jgi:hypothetical protein
VLVDDLGLEAARTQRAEGALDVRHADEQVDVPRRPGSSERRRCDPAHDEEGHVAVAERRRGVVEHGEQDVLVDPFRPPGRADQALHRETSLSGRLPSFSGVPAPYRGETGPCHEVCRPRAAGTSRAEEVQR